MKWGAVALLAAVACRKKSKAPAAPQRPPGARAKPSPTWSETGIASWYGIPYHGRRAANGEIYDMNQLTAAHRTLPFGTMVRVTSETNGKSVTVRITDRGPFIDGRIIDLFVDGTAGSVAYMQAQNDDVSHIGDVDRVPPGFEDRFPFFG